MATFITSKSVGETIQLFVDTSTGYWKYYHNDVYSSVYLSADNYGYPTVENSNGEFTIVSCDSDGTISGDILTLHSFQNQLTSFDGTGLSGLIELDLGENQLTSFDGTGLSSLEVLYMYNNQLTSFDGTELTGLIELDLYENQLTSLDGFIFPTSIEYLYMGNNQLTSFDGTGLSSLIELDLYENQLTSLDVTELTNLMFLALNAMTPQSTDAVLSQLAQHTVEGGYFMTVGGTYTSSINYNYLINDLGWTLSGLEFIFVNVSGGGKLRIKGVTTPR